MKDRSRRASRLHSVLWTSFRSMIYFQNSNPIQPLDCYLFNCIRHQYGFFAALRMTIWVCDLYCKIIICQSALVNRFSPGTPFRLPEIWLERDWCAWKGTIGYQGSFWKLRPTGGKKTWHATVGQDGRPEQKSCMDQRAGLIFT